MRFLRSAWSSVQVVLTLALLSVMAPAALGQGPQHPINPHTQIAWPTCPPGASVYSIVSNTCVQGGTAGNPAGIAGNFQCNAGGVFGTCLGVNTDGASGITVTGGVSAATVVGIRYAKQWQTGGGNNGIANALAPGQMVVADPSYAQTEALPWGTALSTFFRSFIGPKATDPQVQILDTRFGVPNWQMNGSAVGTTRTAYWPSIQTNFTGAAGMTGTFIHPGGALLLQNNVWHGGVNFYNDKTNISSHKLDAYKYSETQGGGDFEHNLYCYGNGDCAKNSGDVFAFGGSNTAGDEGAKRNRELVGEAGEVFTGTTTAVSTAADGTTTVTTTPVNATKTQGEGRILIDTASPYNTGYISSISLVGNIVQYVCAGGCDWDGTYGTSTQTTLTSGIQNPVNGTNSFPQSNVVLNVGSSTGFIVGHLACIFDYDYECEKITAVGTGTVTIATDRKPHPVGTYVTTGGLAGYTIELEADRLNPSDTNGFGVYPDDPPSNLIRNVVPIMYSTAGNVVHMFNSGNGLPAQQAGYQGRAYLSMAGSGGTCTPTVAGGVLTGIAVSGGSGYTGGPPQITFSGSWTIKPVAQVTGYGSSGVSAASIITAGTGLSGVTCTVAASNPYDIYPSAKTVQVWNATTGQVDGTFITQPWPVAPSVGHLLEQPHYFWMHTDGDTNFFVGQYIPTVGGSAHELLGYHMFGSWQGNDRWATVTNTDSSDVYAGYPIPRNTLGRNQLTTPDLLQSVGAFRRGLVMFTPPMAPSIGYAPSMLYTDCGTIGCALWNKPFYIFGNNGVTQTKATTNGLQYNPSLDTYTFFANTYDLSNVQKLALGTPAITAQGGLISQVGQNWNPNSNNLLAGSWTCDAGSSVAADLGQADPYGGALPVWKMTTTISAGLSKGCKDTTSAPFPVGVPVSGSVWILVTSALTICGNIANINDTSCVTPALNTWTRFTMTGSAPSSSFLTQGTFLYLNSSGPSGSVWIFNAVAESGKRVSTSALVNATAASITADIPVNQALEGFDSSSYNLNGVAEGSANGVPGPLDSGGKLPIAQVPTISNATQNVPAQTWAANTCVVLAPVTMTGTTTIATFEVTPISNVSAVVGWGATGGLVWRPWPTANTFNGMICNQTGSPIVQGSAVNFNISVHNNGL